MVERIEVLVFEPFPVQVRVVAYGSLPDGCTKIGKIEDSRKGALFTVRIATTRPANRICTQALTEFQETLPLNTTGLKAGTYTVDVNGIRQSFTLRSDNKAP
jgi:inhibitor of cysteine peptidase